MNPTPRQILDTAAATRIPDSLNLLTSILERASAQNRKTAKPENRNTLMQTLRAKPALMILFVLLALALLSGVVYAVSRSLGYIPGVGIVEQGASLRILAEPVSQTREGITVTVTSVTLAPDKTVISYTIENVPWEALSHREDVPGCYAEGQIRLPNGSLLVPQNGGGGMSADGKWETRMVYSAIPPQFNEAEFLLDCIRETLPGKSPENWKLTLRFIPAPPGLTIMPVVEIPTPAPSPQANGESAPAEGLILEQVIETESGYILVGKFRASGLPASAQALGYSQWPRVTDANGVELPYRTANDVDAISTTIGEFPWTLEIVGKAQAWPLTIHLEGVDAQASDLSAQFTFDTGPNPQPGQEWSLNQDVPLGDFTVRVEKVVFTGAGYYFEMTAPPEVRSVNLEILDTSPLGGSGGNDGRGLLTASVDYAQPPTGPLNILLYAPILTARGDWRLQWQPENAVQAESLYGIRLVLDKFIPLEDGYTLIGHTEWADERIQQANVTLKARDASGRELALDPNFGGELSLPENGWAYKLHGKAFAGDVRLTAADIYVEFSQPTLLTIDLRSFGFAFDDSKLGLPYKMGLTPVDVPGLSAQLFTVAYIQEGDLRGFELAFDADSRLKSIDLAISNGMDTSGLDRIANSGGSSYNSQRGFILSRASTNARLFFPLTFRIYGATVQGDWSLSWTPPAPPTGATPFYIPQACLTLKGWKGISANPPTLPASLTGTLLTSRGALSPDPSLFLVNLDGSQERPLVFGNGSLSADGQRLVYSDENNRLLVWELSNGQRTTLGDGSTPRWSPDGMQIAFNRATPKGQNIFVMNANGSNPRQLTHQTGSLAIAGWTTDGNSLLIQDGTNIELLDITDGARRPLLQTDFNPYGSVTAALSLDGNWLAYLEKVPGRMTPGLYLKSLPAGEPLLLAQLEHWSVYNPVFSPDGQWLAFSVLGNDPPDRGISTAVMNIQTCQFIPLPITGALSEWRP